MDMISLDINGSAIIGHLTNFSETRYVISLVLDAYYEIENGTILTVKFNDKLFSINHGILNTTIIQLALFPFLPSTKNPIRLYSETISAKLASSAIYVLVSISMINPTPASL